jgi:hypothetical protein
MVLYTPQKFDANEIFIIVTLLIVWFFIFKLPRHLSALEILLIWTLNVFFVFTADMSLGVPPVDLYDSNDRVEFEIFDLIIFFIGYPPFAYLALNYYKPREFSWINTAIFIIICALLTTLFEWLALLADVFTFKGWKVYMSFLTYIVIYGFTSIA